MLDVHQWRLEEVSAYQNSQMVACIYMQGKMDVVEFCGGCEGRLTRIIDVVHDAFAEAAPNMRRVIIYEVSVG